MQQVNIMLITTANGPSRVRAAGYKYIMSCNGQMIQGTGKVENTTGNRVVMIALIEALKRMNRISMITILTDSRYLIDSQGQLDLWEQNGWIRSNGVPVRNVDLWEKLRPLMKGHAIRYKFENVSSYRETG